MATASSGYAAAAPLNIERAVTAGSIGALGTIAFGWVMSQAIPTILRWFGLDVGVWGPAELYAVGGVQVIAMTFHETVEIANGILGFLLTICLGGFVIGILFGMYRQRFHGNIERAGIYWGIGLWVLAQVIFIPLLSVKIDPPPGLFSLGSGLEAPIGSLISHLIFGLILGEIYEPHHEVVE